MKFYKAGDTSKAVCQKCGTVVDTTFKYRTVPFNDGHGEVKDVLVAVCDRCDEVVAVPAQSTPSIKAASEQASKSVEVKLRAPFVEALDFAAFRINSEADTSFRKVLLSFYADLNASDESSLTKLSNYCEKAKKFAGEWQALPSKRLSFKCSGQMNEDLEALKNQLNVNRTLLIAGLLLQIQDELITRNAPPRYFAELQRIAKAVNA